MKSELDYNRFRVYSDDGVEAKTFVTFLANIVRNEILMKTKPIRKNRKDYTVQAIINELSRIEITKNSNDEYIRRYGLTKKQKEILSCFELNEDKINSYVKEVNKRASAISG